MNIFIIGIIITKFFLYVGIFFSVGSISYRLLFENKKIVPFRKFTTIFILISFLSSFILFFLKIIFLTGNISGIFEIRLIKLLWNGPVGTTLFLQIIGLMIISIGLPFRRLIMFSGPIGSFFLLISLTQIGHTSNTSSLLAPSLLLIHLTGISIWSGILFPLYQISKNKKYIPETIDIARTFGTMASFFVPILLIAGIWLAYLLLGSWKNIFFTTYGQVIILKVTIVSCLLGLAALNKIKIIPCLQTNNLSVLKWLKKSVLCEIFLIGTIFLITAILTSTLSAPTIS